MGPTPGPSLQTATKSCAASYVSAVWGWNEGDQPDYHTRVFVAERLQIITSGNQDHLVDDARQSAT